MFYRPIHSCDYHLRLGVKLVSVIRDSESGYREQTSQIALTSDLPRRKDPTSGEYNSSLCGQNDGGVDGCLEFEGSHCVRTTYLC